MKSLFATLFTGALAGLVVATAGPLQPAHLPADTRWVLHLDLEALLATSVGDTLAREAVEPKMVRPREELKARLGVDFDWRRIRSITFCGAEYGGPERLRGVMLVDTDLDVAGAMEAAMEKLASAGGKAPDLQRVEGGDTPLYCFNEDVYVALQPGVPLVVGKARRTVLQAREVLLGGAPNLNTTSRFSGLTERQGCFLWLGATGFGEAVPVPPKARILQMAESLQITLAEAGGQVKGNAALTARTCEQALQMYQVVQGMTALAALSQSDNRDLQTLLAGLRSTLADEVVSVELTLPAADVAAKITQRERRPRATP